MTTKIFGALMIISGGYLLGWVRSHQQKRRLGALKKLYSIAKNYEGNLSEYRDSALDYFESQGSFIQKLLMGEPQEGLLKEDSERFCSLINSLKKAAYQEALEQVRKYILDLAALISAMEEEGKTAGKALPLVTGAIGFLVAVFLF